MPRSIVCTHSRARGVRLASRSRYRTQSSNHPGSNSPMEEDPDRPPVFSDRPPHRTARDPSALGHLPPPARTIRVFPGASTTDELTHRNRQSAVRKLALARTSFASGQRSRHLSA